MKRLFVFVLVLFFVAILQIFGFYLILCLEFQENRVNKRHIYTWKFWRPKIDLHGQDHIFCEDPERPVADVETIYKFSSLVKKADYMDIFKSQSGISDGTFCEISSPLSASAIFSEGSTLDVWMSSKCTSGLCDEYI